MKYIFLSIAFSLFSFSLFSQVVGIDGKGERMRMKTNKIAYENSTGDSIFSILHDSVFIHQYFKLLNYGSGTVTGTPTKYLAVESDGDVIEVDGSSIVDTVLEVATKYDLTNINVIDSSITHPYLRSFRNSLQSDFEIVMLGDSRTSRYWTPIELINNFSKNYTFGGIGYVSFGDATPTFIGGVNAGGVVQDITGTGLQSTSGLALTLDDVADDYTITTTTTQGEFSKIDIWYYQQTGGGDFTITIDGTLNQTVATAGAESVQKISITGLVDSNHTIVFEKTAGGNVDLLEMYLRKESGFVFNVIGNSGASSQNFATQITNRHFFTDKQPDLVLIRLGVNGNDIDFPQVGADNHETITNSILAVSTGTEFIWTGEPSNGSGDTNEDIINYNTLLLGKADSNNVAFANMFEVIPDWNTFFNGGYGDAITHENIKGGYILADWYSDFIFNGKYQPTSSGGIATGITNRLAYYNSTDGITNADIYTDGSKVEIGATTGLGEGKLNVDGESETLVVIGAGADTANPLFTINDKAGRLSMDWNAKYNGTNYISTFAETAAQIRKGTNRFHIALAPAVSVGGVVTYNDRFTLFDDGLLWLNGYSSSNFPGLNSGTTSNYPVFDTNGFLRPRTAAEFIAPFNLVTTTDFQKTDTTVVAFGTRANQVNPVFTINDVGGRVELAFNSQWDGTNYISTAAETSIFLRKGSNRFYISTAPATTVGNPVTYDDKFTLFEDGLLWLKGYSSLGFNDGTVAGYPVFDANGIIRQRSLAEMQTDFGVLGNIYTTDGTLTGDRTVTMGGNDINFTGGNVGIGTTTPDSKLHIKGNTFKLNGDGNNTYFYLQSGGGNKESVMLFGNNANRFAYEIPANLNDFRIRSLDGGVPTSLYLSYSTGDIAIGHNSPSAKTHIVGNGSTTGKSFFVENSLGDDNFTILDNGNVGIGTVTPDRKLDIENGTLRLSDLGGGTFTGTETYLLGVESDGDVVEVDLANGMDAVVSSRSYVDNTAALVDLVSGQVYYNTTSSTFVVLP